MKIYINQEEQFHPYSLHIDVEDKKDHDILRNLLLKAKREVKEQGIYDSILDKILSAMGDR